MNTLWLITLRNIKIYLKDKANIFFSLLSPVIILVLYLLFIGKLQTDGLTQALAEMGVTGAEAEVKGSRRTAFIFPVHQPIWERLMICDTYGAPFVRENVTERPPVGAVMLPAQRNSSAVVAFEDTAAGTR